MQVYMYINLPTLLHEQDTTQELILQAWIQIHSSRSIAIYKVKEPSLSNY